MPAIATSNESLLSMISQTGNGGGDGHSGHGGHGPGFFSSAVEAHASKKLQTSKNLSGLNNPEVIIFVIKLDFRSERPQA